ncbi:MAG: hypothetical protein HY959_06535 [Ignavibacteriae bacterium]|nr:hypothetical protein [Ignavibacteriota bacterium]
MKRSEFFSSYAKQIFLLIIIILTYKNGDTQTWWHAFRTAGQYYQRGWDICQVKNGDFIIAGQCENGPRMKINLIKINKLGNVIWSNVYSDSSTYDIYAMTCAVSSDSCCVIAGYRSDYKPYAMKINQNGDLIWKKTYGNQNIYYSTNQIIRCSDNGYLMSGFSYVLKIDSLGQYVWSKNTSELGNSGEIYSIIETFDNGYLCSGHLPDDYNVITKVDIDGNILWQKIYYNINANCNIIRKLSNCYLLMGYAADSIPYPNTNFKYYFAKIDTSGNVISQHHGFDSTGRTEHFMRGLDVLDDNRFVFTSYDYYDFYSDSISLTVFKIVDSTGKIIHKNIIKKSNNGGYDPRSILPLNDGHIMYVGTAYFSGYSSDRGIFVARTDTMLYIDPLSINSNSNFISKNFKLFQNYPNPFNPTTNIRYFVPSIVNHQSSIIRLVVYDILGKEIATLVNEKQKPGSYEVQFDARHGGSSSLPSGVYYYVLYADGVRMDARKMILLK